MIRVSVKCCFKFQDVIRSIINSKDDYMRPVPWIVILQLMCLRTIQSLCTLPHLHSISATLPERME